MDMEEVITAQPKVRPLISIHPCRGPSTYFWHNNCSPVGPLLEYYGQQFQLVAGIPTAAKVSCITSNDVRTWPFLSLPAPDFCLIPMLLTRSFGRVLLPPTTRLCSWNAFRIHYPLVSWQKVIWFSNNITRHSFILWMAVRRS